MDGLAENIVNSAQALATVEAELDYIDTCDVLEKYLFSVFLLKT